MPIGHLAMPNVLQKYSLKQNDLGCNVDFIVTMHKCFYINRLKCPKAIGVWLDGWMDGSLTATILRAPAMLKMASQMHVARRIAVSKWSPSSPQLVPN